MRTSADAERRSIREPITIPAWCRTATGVRGKITVTDLSADGCGIMTEGMNLAAGKRVQILTGNLEPLPGVIVWCKGNCAGIEFSRRLYRPVVDHMRRTFPKSLSGRRNALLGN